jgi:Na+-driven multidrug efflux pump
MNLVDTAFIGNLSPAQHGPDALAGVAIASGILTFSFYIFNFFTSVTTPLISKQRAAKNEKEAILMGGQALTLALVLGVALSLILLSASGGLLDFMAGSSITSTTATDAVTTATTTTTAANDIISSSSSSSSSSYQYTMQYAKQFFTIRACAAPAVLLSSASTGILRGYLDSKTAFYIIVLSNIVNFTLDVILIGGLEYGPLGAAIATTTSEYLAMGLFLGVLAGVLPSAEGLLGKNQQQRKFLLKDDEEEIITTSSAIDIDIDIENDNLVLMPEKEQQQNQQQLLPRMKTENTRLSSSSSSLIIQDQNDDINNSNNKKNMITITPAFQLISWSSMKPLITASSSSFSRSIILQIVVAGAAAMAARTGNVANIAAHQISLQIWLFSSFVCDALAAASQALVSDAIGRDDIQQARKICKTVFRYSFILGCVLMTAIFVGTVDNGVLVSLFTNDLDTKLALTPILLIVTASQPLNAYVFTADGVLQGLSEFVYEAKSMALSASVAVTFFIVLNSIEGTTSLSHIWYALVSLMVMRGVTTTAKIVDPNGPIDLLEFKK